MTEDEEILLAFLEESRENLDQLDRDLVDLESRSDDAELLGRVFRAVHTLKGTCGFLGFPRLEALAHAGEDLLGALRDGTLLLGQDSASSLLRLVDVVREVLAVIEATSAEPDVDHGPLVAELRSHLPVPDDDDPPPAEPTAPASAEPPGPAEPVEPAEPVQRAEPAEPAEPAERAERAEPVAPLPAPAPLPPVPAAAPEPTASPVPAPAAPSLPPAAPPGPAPATSETSVRVDVAVLDQLMDLVGELVLARSRIGELAVLDDEGTLAASYRELRVVTSDLQDSVMTARLQPVGIVTGKFHRIARDLAAALGKQVVVQVEGEDVGVDKAVNEALRDPLLHLVRNAMDHGIETPSERVAAGKPAAGTLRIRAYHESGRVHVEVSDDGRGVDAPALLAKAVAAGVVAPDRAGLLDPDAVLDLMFEPGLSTRDEVTSTSGRGVGMDVVRASLEAVGGSIDVTSRPGQGVHFRLNVPLTLAIMPVLVTWSGGNRYAVPQVHLQEVTQLDPAAVAERVDDVEGARLLRLRGRLLPLVDLAARLGVPSARDDGSLVVVVVESDGRRFGLLVDDLGDSVDAVVKPLPRLLRGIPVFTGTTILGDGLPALVLDVPGLASSAGIALGAAEEAAPAHTGADRDGLLLATAPDGGRLGLRLSAVHRLESFAADQVERSGDVDVIRYREAILPLVRVADVLPERRAAPRDERDDAGTGELATVVCSTSLGPVGFVVASIDDVVAEPEVPPQPPSRRGVEACVVVDERVVELLDVEVLTVEAGIGRSA